MPNTMVPYATCSDSACAAAIYGSAICAAREAAMTICESSGGLANPAPHLAALEGFVEQVMGALIRANAPAK
jgi:hypothetical protein